jgi:hypothetical protein
MTAKFGENAGLVWNALANGKQEIKALKKATKLNDKEVYAALGWLAREGKVEITEQAKDVFVCLK